MKHTNAATTTLLALLLVGGASTASADDELWTEVGVRHDLSRRSSLGVDVHLRMDAATSQIVALMPEVGLGYRLRRSLRTGIGYRLEYEADKMSELQRHHRGYGWASLRGELGVLRLEHRLLLQEEVRPERGERFRHTVRNRAQAELRALRRLVPAASIESHHIVADADDDDGIRLDRVWLTSGFAWEDAAVTLELFYRVDLVTADAPARILGLGMKVDI